MTKEEKVSKLKEWLKEKGIKFHADTDKYPVPVDIYIPYYRIGVSTDEDNDDFFKWMNKTDNRTFFIRERESMDFIIEKMENSLTDAMERRTQYLCHKAWKEIGYGKKHRHNIGIEFEDFDKEFRELAAKTTRHGAAEALVEKYKATNYAYYEQKRKELEERVKANKRKREEAKKKYEAEKKHKRQRIHVEKVVPHKRQRIHIGAKIEKVEPIRH